MIGWILLAVGLYFLVTIFLAIVSEDEYGDAWAVQAGIAGFASLVIAITWWVMAANNGPNLEKECADAGKIWYDETASADVCYTKEQYKIVKDLHD